MTPFASSPSALQVVAQVRGPNFSGVALINAVSGAVEKTIDAFADPRAYQAGGDFDGRYALWKEYKSPGDLDEYDVKTWDRATGRVTVVGGARHDAKGRVIPGTWQDPVVDGAYGAWVEGLDDRGRGDIVLLDLRTGKRTVVRRGHPGWIDLAHGLLLWAESPRPGKSTILRAYDVKTRTPVPPPVAVAQVRGGWGFVSDGTGMAWIAGNSNDLYYAPSMTQSPVLIAHLSIGGFSPPLAISAGIVAAPISAGGLLTANVSTHAYTVLPQASTATRIGRKLLVVRAAISKTEDSTAALATLGRADVGALTCTSG